MATGEQSSVKAPATKAPSGPVDSLWLRTGTTASPVDMSEADSVDYCRIALFYGGLPTGAELSEVERPVDARRLVTELRRMSGLRWNELARVFNVDRRALHYWATGKPPSQENLVRLRRVLDFVAQHQQDEPRSTRSHLLEPAADGRSLLDQLVEQVSGSGESAREPVVPARSVTTGKRPPTLSRETRAQRLAFRPEDLLGSGPSDEHPFGPKRKRPPGSDDG